VKWAVAEAAVRELSIIDVKEILMASDVHVFVEDEDESAPPIPIELTLDIEKFRIALVTKLTRI
jgi:hypothetical protein